MATHFLPLSKNVSCTSTPQGKHLCQISWELVKNWGSSSRRKISGLHHFCHNMPLPWQHTFYHCQKMCLAHLHPKANICAKFHENWWKTEEVVRDARFFPHFCHNMPLPWQHSFCHCRKMCLAHLHSKANISAKFHENWSKTEEVVRDARLATNRPTDRPPDRPPDDTLIPIYPPYTLRVCGGIIILVSSRTFSPTDVLTIDFFHHRAQSTPFK